MRTVRAPFFGGLLGLLLLNPVHAAGQTSGSVPRSAEHAWRISVAAVHQTLRDEISSSIRQRGNGVWTGLGYRSHGDRGAWAIDLAYAAPSLTPVSPPGTDTREDTHEFALVFRYLRKVGGARDGHFNVLVGGGTTAQLFVRIHRYGDFGSETYADFFAPLQLQAMWEYTTGKGTLSERLALPVLSLVVRDPYTGAKYWPGMEVASPFSVPVIHHVLAYRLPLGSSWNIEMAAETAYLRYPVPRSLKVTTQRLALTLEWRP